MSKLLLSIVLLAGGVLPEVVQFESGTRILRVIHGRDARATSATCSTTVWPAQLTPSETEDKSCRQHPQLVGKCFMIHGRLSVYNGAPAMRIWKVGTKRMLGISEQRFAVEGFRNVPETIQNQLNQDVEIFGDFLVCPFTRQKAGEMQMVCVEEGKNLKVRKRQQ